MEKDMQLEATSQSLSMEDATDKSLKLSKRQRRNRNKQLFKLQQKAVDETHCLIKEPLPVPSATEKNSPQEEPQISPEEANKQKLAQLKDELAKKLFGGFENRHKWFNKQNIKKESSRPGHQARRPESKKALGPKPANIERKICKEQPSAAGPTKEEKLSPQQQALRIQRKRESIWSYCRVDKTSRKELRQWLQDYTELVDHY